MSVKYSLFTAFFMSFSVDIIACVTCNEKLQEAIADSSYRPDLLVMLSAFIVLTILVLLLLALTYHNYPKAVFFASGVPEYISFTCAAIITGIGLGGFLDGIILHQILQWHGMLSNKLPLSSSINKSVNMFWDGIFHLFVFSATVIGMLRVWKLAQDKTKAHSGMRLFGGMLLGWGLFNVVEGTINHHILKLHNVREGLYSDEWNYGFLFFSLFLLSTGILLVTRRRKSVVKIAKPQ